MSWDVKNDSLRLQHQDWGCHYVHGKKRTTKTRHGESTKADLIACSLRWPDGNQTIVYRGQAASNPLRQRQTASGGADGTRFGGTRVARHEWSERRGLRAPTPFV